MCDQWYWWLVDYSNKLSKFRILVCRPVRCETHEPYCKSPVIEALNENNKNHWRIAIREQRNWETGKLEAARSDSFNILCCFPSNFDLIVAEFIFIDGFARPFRNKENCTQHIPWISFPMRVLSCTYFALHFHKLNLSFLHDQRLIREK